MNKLALLYMFMYKANITCINITTLCLYLFWKMSLIPYSTLPISVYKEPRKEHQLLRIFCPGRVFTAL